MTSVIVWTRRESKGWNGELDPETVGRLPRHHTRELGEALAATYETDAHFVPYVVINPECEGGVELRPWRINKRGLAQLREDGAGVRFDLIVIDVDAPPAIRRREGPRRIHSVARWYEGQKRELAVADPSLAKSAWAYSTRGGCRFLWLLDEPLDAEAYEDANRALREHIEEATKGAIKPDPLSDWTRCYRLPNVQRDGRSNASRVIIGEGNLDADKLPAAAPKDKRKRIRGLANAKAPLDSQRVVREPGRNSYLTRVAGAFRRLGMEYEELADALLARNERLCDPPLDDDEVESIAASVCGYAVGDEEGELDAEVDPERERGLSTGSESEVAEVILAETLEGLHGEPLVYDHGALWRYEDKRGVWEELRKSEVTGHVLPFDGTITGSGKSTRSVRVSSGFATGVYKLISELRDEPGFFDDARPALAFKNGLVCVDGDDLEIRNHDPDARKRFVLPFEYSDRAKAPRWRRFLGEIFEGDDDRDAKVALLGEFVGACLFGQATRYQRALLLTGDGANGKSTFLNAISALFPAVGRASVPPQDLGDPYNRATLAGIAINMVTEMPERELLASEALKAMVDGSIVRARHPYGRPFDFRASAGMLFAANDLPGVRDTSHGFWRRWLAISFNRTFEGSAVDTKLDDALRAELPGIAVWALEGVERLLKQDGYTVPPSSDATRDEWRHEADNVRAFIDDKVDKGETYETTADALYGSYKRYCEEKGLRACGAPKFGKRVVRAGIKRHRTAVGRFYLCRLRPRAVPITKARKPRRAAK